MSMPPGLLRDITDLNKDHLEHPDSCSKQTAQGKHNIIEQHWYNSSRVSPKVLFLQSNMSVKVNGNSAHYSTIQTIIL